MAPQQNRHRARLGGLVVDDQDAGLARGGLRAPGGRGRGDRRGHVRPREDHAERAPPPDLALDLDPAAQADHDPVRDREAEAGAGAERLGGEERPEQPRQHVLRHALPGCGALQWVTPKGAFH